MDNNLFISFYSKVNALYKKYNYKDKQIYNAKLIKTNIDNIKKISKNFFQQSNFFNFTNFDINNNNTEVDFLSNDTIYIILPFIDSCIITPSNEYLQFLSSCLMSKYDKKKCTFLNIRFVRFPNKISYTKDINSIYKKYYIENKKYYYLKIIDFQLINFTYNKEFNEKVDYLLELFKQNNSKKRKRSDNKKINNKKVKIIDSNTEYSSDNIETIGNRVSKRNKIVNKKSNKLIFGNNYNEWVSPTQTRNYLLNDPIIDWLKYYGEKNGYLPDNIIKGEYDYFSFIMERGQEFEIYIYNYLKNNYSNDIIKISSENSYFNLENVNKTLEHIKNGTPIIYQANLISYKNKTYGIADLIIKKSFLIEHFQLSGINEDIFNDNLDNYVVVDIKYSTLKNTKKNYLKNGGSVRCYKGQVILYTDMLNEMQESNEEYGFLFGRRLLDSDENVKDGKIYLGTIDINENDILIKEKSYKGIEWIRWLRKNGDKYHPLNNTIKELMPNMCNKLDYPWHKMKKNISYAQSEITLLWNCGVKHRNKAIENNCYSFNDDNFDLDNIGLTENKKKIIKPIMEINNDNNNDNYTKDIESNILRNINKNKNMIFYIDFEFLNTCEISFSHLSRTHLYMIGLGYINPLNNQWEYEVFITKLIDEESEQTKLREWLDRMNYLKNKFNKEKMVLIHWSKAEPSLYKKLIRKYNIENNLDWYDLLLEFKKIPFVQKNIFDFNLKNVAKRMKENNLIETEWRSAVLDGLGASVAIIKGLKKVGTIDKIEEIDEIINYNEVDCKVLSEMYNYIQCL